MGGSKKQISGKKQLLKGSTFFGIFLVAFILGFLAFLFLEIGIHDRLVERRKSRSLDELAERDAKILELEQENRQLRLGESYYKNFSENLEYQIENLEIEVDHYKVNSVSISDWEQYKNEKYGFSYKIPSEFDIVEVSDNEATYKMIDTENPVNYGGQDEYPTEKISISLRNERYNLAEINGIDCPLDEDCTERETINGINFVSTVYGDAGCGSRTTYFNINQAGVRIIFLTCNNPVYGRGINQEIEIQRKILGSIKR